MSSNALICLGGGSISGGGTLSRRPFRLLHLLLAARLLYSFPREMTEPIATPAHAATAATLDLLRGYESPNVTYMAPDGYWPIVWERAKGVQVWDAEGRRYCDL